MTIRVWEKTLKQSGWKMIRSLEVLHPTPPVREDHWKFPPCAPKVGKMVGIGCASECKEL